MTGPAAPLALTVLFQPPSAAAHEVVWIAAEEGEVAGGEDLLRYRAADGETLAQAAPATLRVRRHRTGPGAWIEPGAEVLACEVPSLALDLEPLRRTAAELQMELAQAVNTAFKGLVAADGQGGHIAKSVIPIRQRLEPERGVDDLIGQIVAAIASADLRDGDVVVVSESLFAIAQGRLFPLELLYEVDPKTTDERGRAEALRRIRAHVPDTEPEDLLCADALPDLDPPRATAGMRDPNAAAHRLAERLLQDLGRRCDVVISDTDTGLEVRETLIGCVTIGSTPLGATAGLVLYECMRVSCAAEFCRGSSRGIPVVVCRPHERRATRAGIGEARSYPGRLSLRRERLIGYA